MQISNQLFDDWVRQYHRLLYGIAYWWTGSQSDAEEITQEAFFQAYRSRSTLRDIASAKSWLVGILRHCYSQMSRKNHRRAEISLDEVANGDTGRGYLESEPSDQDAILALHQSLARLDDRYRLPVVLFYFHDLSYREIAEALELPVGTVMSRLSRAREMLHNRLSAAPELKIVKKGNRA